MSVGGSKGHRATKRRYRSRTPRTLAPRLRESLSKPCLSHARLQPLNSKRAQGRAGQRSVSVSGTGTALVYHRQLSSGVSMLSALAGEKRLCRKTLYETGSTARWQESERKTRRTAIVPQSGACIVEMLKSKEPAMDKPDEVERERAFTANSASGADLRGSTLLPMLIAGLILILVGMAVVVAFVV